jgi:hypothetical protein
MYGGERGGRGERARERPFSVSYACSVEYVVEFCAGVAVEPTLDLGHALTKVEKINVWAGERGERAREGRWQRYQLLLIYFQKIELADGTKLDTFYTSYHAAGKLNDLLYFFTIYFTLIFVLFNVLFYVLCYVLCYVLFYFCYHRCNHPV